MTKPLRILTSLLLIAVVGWLAWRASGPREPVFEARTLTSWLDHHVASSAASPPYGSPGWKKADEVLRSIGTNAIPTGRNREMSVTPVTIQSENLIREPRKPFGWETCLGARGEVSDGRVPPNRRCVEPP